MQKVTSDILKSKTIQIDYDIKLYIFRYRFNRCTQNYLYNLITLLLLLLFFVQMIETHK